MFDWRLDLPLMRDRNARLLPWLLGVMIYLAVLGLGAAMALDNLARDWQRGLSGEWTIVLPPDDEIAPEARDRQIADLVAIVAATPGIASARAIAQDEMAQLLAPWFGDADTLTDLPLPSLIGVILVPDGIVDRVQLKERMAQAAPKARLDAHEDWSQAALRFLSWLRSLAAIALLLIAAAALLAVVQVARAGLAIHRDLVEIVHLLGATDAYIARQFQIQALRSAVTGGGIGTILALASLFALGRFGFDAAIVDILPAAASGGWGFGRWLALACLPLAMGGLAMIAARWAVLRALARLP